MWSGYVYRIHCNITGEDYYGSTETDIEKRITDHVAHTNYKKKVVNKCASEHIIERDDWCYEIMEEVDYIIKTDLLIRERYYIENYPCINLKIPYKTMEELRDYVKLKRRQYRLNTDFKNRELEYKRIKRDCPCGGKYTNGSRATHLKSKKHKRYIDNN